MSKERKLSRAERKEIEALIARANKSDKKELTAQDSIPYQRMYPDGICRVTDSRYVKTIRFQDINYQLSQNEDKTAIFDGWCDFLPPSSSSSPSSTSPRRRRTSPSRSTFPSKGMNLIPSGRNTRICSAARWQKDRTAFPRPNT